MPPTRLLPLAAAAVYASRDPLELATLLGSLEAGLSGLRELTHLYDLGVVGGDAVDPQALRSAYQEAARHAMSTPWPGSPGWPGGEGMPGWGGWTPRGPGGGWHPGWPGGGWTPGWPGAPLPIPTPGRVPEVPPIIIDGFEACLEEMIPGMHARGYGIGQLFGSAGTRYEVTSVFPSHACPGADITLRGSGFEGTTEVRFTGPAGRTVSASPRDPVEGGVIRVLVPEWAMTGPVWPYIPERIPVCHGHAITVARPGSTPAGSTPTGLVYARFEVNEGAGCVALGAEAALHWAVEPDVSDVIVRQHDGDGSPPTELYNGVGPAGTILLDTTTPGRRTFTIRVVSPSGSCGRKPAISCWTSPIHRLR